MISKKFILFNFRPGEDQNIPWGSDFVSYNFKATICYFHNFSLYIFRPQEHTSPTILMDAKQ